MKILILLFTIISCSPLMAESPRCKEVVNASGSADTTSTLKISTNALRCCLMIINTGAANLLVKQSSAHSSSEGVVIPPGGNYEPYIVPLDSFYMKTASGSTTYNYYEGACL